MEELRYRVRHQTSYLYSGRVDLCHSLAHLTPREEGGARILSHRLAIDPLPDFLVERFDYFGNQVHYFSIQSPHTELTVISLFIIEKQPAREFPECSGMAWDAYPSLLTASDEDGVLLEEYLLPTGSHPVIDETMAFLRPSLEPGKDVLTLADELTSRIYREFEYSPGTTETGTPLREVLKDKKGVCQDFAHIMIACFGALRIPARYVSGYLETIPPPGQPKLLGADASHAWVEIFVQGMGWIPFDPTNNQRPGDRHIKLCHGRDYFDVQPLRGAFLGSGSQILRVEVDVERL